MCKNNCLVLTYLENPTDFMHNCIITKPLQTILLIFTNEKKHINLLYIFSF